MTGKFAVTKITRVKMGTLVHTEHRLPRIQMACAYLQSWQKEKTTVTLKETRRRWFCLLLPRMTAHSWMT